MITTVAATLPRDARPEARPPRARGLYSPTEVREWGERGACISAPGSTPDNLPLSALSECGGKEVIGGAVEVVAAAVVAPCRAGVGVAEGVLDVLERGAQAQGFGCVGVAQAVWRDAGGQAGGAAESAELLVGELVAVAVTVGAGHEDRAGGALCDVVIERAHHRGSERHARWLATLAGHLEHSVAVVVAVVADVGAERFGDAQPAEGQQRDECSGARAVRGRGGEQATQLLGGQAHRL